MASASPDKRISNPMEIGYTVSVSSLNLCPALRHIADKDEKMPPSC